jgi:O-antigen/teichoic acid export membrane protein
LTVADAAQKGATGLLALLLARFLGPQDYGLLAGVLAFTALFMMLTDLGFEQELVRRSRHADPGESLALTFGSIGVTLLGTVLGLAIVVQRFPSLVWPVSLIALAMGVHAVNRLALPFRYLCLALGRTHVPAIVQSASTAALVGSTLLGDRRFAGDVHWKRRLARPAERDRPTFVEQVGRFRPGEPWENGCQRH